jgi:hypothetical protein
LIVHDPFEGYAIGDRIEDPETVASVLGSEYSARVIRVKALHPPGRVAISRQWKG